MSKHKMKLITNENNIDALKIAICAYEVKQQIEVVLGTTSGDLVPSLIDESSDLKLFVVNSACLFLHENAQSLSGKTIEEVQDLLDWEASVLRPILSTYHATKKVSLTHLQSLKFIYSEQGSLLNYLDFEKATIFEGIPLCFEVTNIKYMASQVYNVKTKYLGDF